MVTVDMPWSVYLLVVGGAALAALLVGYPLWRIERRRRERQR